VFSSLPPLPLRTKYFLHHPVLNTLNLCSSLSAIEEVSHPYKTTGKIIIFFFACGYKEISRS